MGSEIATPDPLQDEVAGLDEKSDDMDNGADATTNVARGGSEQKDTPNTGPKYQEPDQPTNYSLFSNPPNLGAMRERMFKVEEPIQLSPLDFEAYFKFMDNVWRKEKGEVSQEDGNTVEIYCCKLKNSKTYAAKHIPDEQRKRKKVERAQQECDMTMKVIYSGGAIPTCTITHGGGHGVKGLKHTHDLDFMDQNKRCSGIMDVARREANKGFLASSTYDKMWEEPEKMQDAGGAHMKISDARNVQIPWRDANRDVAYKVHTGYTGSRTSTVRRNRPSLAAASPAPKKQRVARPIFEQNPQPRPIPSSTLHYPDHARTFLEEFMPNYSKIKTRPHVTLTYAQSLDGRISLMPGVQTKISGPETKAMTHYLRSMHDAILIGVRTAVADDPSLNCRLSGVGGYGGHGLDKQPRPIIIDPDGRLHIKPEMKILQAVVEGRGKAPWVIVKRSAMLQINSVNILKSYGGEYLQILSEPNGRDISWTNIFKALFGNGLRSIMVEGGGVVLSELLKPHYAHLLDSVIVTIAPTFMGKSGTAVSPDSTIDRNGVPVPMKLTNVRWQPMGDEDVVMCGSLKQEAPKNGILSELEQFANAAPLNPAPQSNGNDFVPVNGQQGPANGGRR
jgi:2,5-diamino-6-(ribosylamino)-4(3H)-pyrimidinone 5'-phosphate reductase